jgi:DNA-binding LacI/PurR family transcriptional regulator
MLFCIDEGMDERQLISILLNYRVSGVVITSDAPPAEICEECARVHVPLALVDRADDLPFVDHINGNDVNGGRMAADTLIKAGRKRLVGLLPVNPAYSLSTRIAAFCERVGEHGLSAEIVHLGGNEYDSGRDIAAEISKRRGQGLGIFCPSDVYALGLLDGLRTRYGVRVPEQMSLIGYDDIPQASWAFANLTTIKQSVEEFARVTVKLLKQRIGNPQARPNSIIVDVTLVRRGTV